MGKIVWHLAFADEVSFLLPQLRVTYKSTWGLGTGTSMLSRNGCTVFPYTSLAWCVGILVGLTIMFLGRVYATMGNGSLLEPTLHKEAPARQLWCETFV